MENGKHSMSVNYFYFGSIALHYSSYMAFLYLLLFLSYPDIQGRDCGTAIVPVSMNSFWRENIKTKTQRLGQWVWQMLQLSARNRKYIHQLFISPNQRTRPWGSDRLCFLLYCHWWGWGWGGRGEGRKKNQKLGVWLNGLFSWNFSFSNKQRFKHQTPTLWNLLPTLSCICSLTEYNKGRKKVVCQQNFSGNTYTFLSS